MGNDEETAESNGERRERAEKDEERRKRTRKNEIRERNQCEQTAVYTPSADRLISQ
jgi:hypothetical protein